MENIGFKIERNLGVNTYKLTKISAGLENSNVLQKVFGKDLKKFLEGIKIAVTRREWIIRVDTTGRILINQDYLKNCEEKILYLDLVHELIHIKQLRNGHNVYPQHVKYVNMPTEIEAYRLTVEEARKIGMSDDEIKEYLKVDWIDDSDHKKLIEAVM